MNAQLTEALAGLNLKPGETYRTEINGQTLEVRIIGRVTSPTGDSDGQPDIEPWADLRSVSGGRTMRVKAGDGLWPKRLELTDEELAE